MSRRNARARAMLFLIAYLRQNRGAHVKDVARMLNVSPRVLRGMLEQLTLCGKHPFGPGDLIDVWIERDRIFLDVDQRLGSLVRLSQDEAVALFVALRSGADAGPGHPLAHAARSALTKLRPSVSEDADARVRALETRISIRGEPTPEDGGPLARLRGALDALREVEIVYFARSSEQLRPRRLRTYALIQHLGAWYAVGRDSVSRTVRVFKVERIKEVQNTDVRYRIPASFRAERYRRNVLFVGAKAHVARVRVQPPLAAIVQEEWPESRFEQEASGEVVVHIQFGRPEGLAASLLRYGEAIEVLAPDTLRHLIYDRCQAMLARHRGEAFNAGA